MTRFTQSGGMVLPDGSSLTVMARPEDNLSALIDSGSDALIAARGWLQTTVASLRRRPLPKVVLDGATRYLSADLNKSYLDAQRAATTIDQVVNAVATGLAGDVTIKTSTRVGANDADVYGHVSLQNFTAHYKQNATNPEARRLLSEPKTSAEYQKRTYRSFTFDRETGDLLLTRAIKIDSERLCGPLHLAAKTLIHEASHKYAGTIDAFRVNDDGSISPESIDKQRAIINADSYAWFVLFVGHPMRR